MSEENEKQKEIEEICQRIEKLAASEHLSDEEKMSFAQKALQIIHGDCLK